MYEILHLAGQEPRSVPTDLTRVAAGLIVDATGWNSKAPQ